MARKRNRVVRVADFNLPTGKLATLTVPLLLEQLRYAGIIRIIKDNDTGIVFDIIAPAQVDSEWWAETNALRMKSFSINAVDAPEIL